MPRFLALLALASLPLSLGLTIGDQVNRQLCKHSGQTVHSYGASMAWPAAARRWLRTCATTRKPHGSVLGRVQLNCS